MSKAKIQVFVGDPVLDRYGNSGRNFIRISNRESISLEYCSLKQAISKLSSLQRKYSDRYEDLSFNAVSDCGCRYDCSCSPTVYLMGKRYETEIELNLRLAEEAAKVIDQRQRDERELALIAARLGKTVT